MLLSTSFLHLLFDRKQNLPLLEMGLLVVTQVKKPVTLDAMGAVGPGSFVCSNGDGSLLEDYCLVKCR